VVEVVEVITVALLLLVGVVQVGLEQEHHFL
jgi:hypothetical protein